MYFKVKWTYNARKLEKKLKDFLIKDTVKNVAEATKDDIVEGLESGRGTKGTFADIQESTRKVRRLRGQTGNKPLIASGEMKNSLKVKPGNKYNSSLEAISYGSRSNPNAHETNHTTKNNPKIEGERFYFRGKEIPARPWFHDEETFQSSATIDKKVDSIAKKYFDEFNKAFTKRSK
jgi:hypothetical protein